MKYFCIIILIMLFGCTSKKKECVIRALDILNNSPKKVHAVYDENHKIIGVSDNDSHTNKAGAYYFFNTGKLQSYKFFKTDLAYCYNEEYNETGQLIRQEGIPIVDENVREVNIDSAVVKLLIFSLNRYYEPAKITINKGQPFFIDLAEDSLRSNIKTSVFGLNTTGLKNLTIYISIEFKNECTGTKGLVSDTIYMEKNPRLNFVSGG